MADPLLDLSYPGHLARLIRAGIGAAALARAITLVPQLQHAADPATAAPLLWGDLVTAVTWPVIAALWVGASVALVAGVRSRAAAGTLAVLAFGVIGADQATLNNHVYALGVVALVLAVAGPQLDGRPGAPGRAMVAGWPIAALRVLVTIVYLFAGLAKINEDFLSGLVLHENLSTSLFTAGLPDALLRSPVLLTVLALVVVVLELGIAVAVWVRRAWTGTFLAALVLHAPMPLLANSWSMALHLSVFAVVMWTLLLAFKEPLRPCRVHGGARAPGASLQRAGGLTGS